MTRIAVAYFANAHVSPSEIPLVMQLIWDSLEHGGSGNASKSAQPDSSQEPEHLAIATPAAVRRSITPDALISFEDGRPYKTLKRHLASRGLTPDEYRRKWRLPADYPMVAANYSAVRAETARKTGLGLLGQNARAARKPKEGTAALDRAVPSPTHA